MTIIPVGHNDGDGVLEPRVGAGEPAADPGARRAAQPVHARARTPQDGQDDAHPRVPSRGPPRPLQRFFVTRKRSEDLRAEFAEVLAQEQPALAGERLSWDALLRACFDAARHDPLTVVFDEFQTFRYVDPGVFSILQKHWDTLHGERRIHLIAVGSLMTLMERIFTGAKEPLARRATAQLRVDPFTPTVVAGLVRRAGRRSMRDVLRYWTVFGGCPKYYALADDADLLGEDVL